jgi:Fe-S oxidoreductase
MEEIRNTGADMMITSCPKCVSHFECLKFEGDERHDIEILDVVSFLARQVEAKKTGTGEVSTANVSVEA